MTELKDRTVLVTGATGGFGSEMTRQFLAAGCRLVLTDLSQAALESLRDAQGDDAGRIVALIPADLSTDAGASEIRRGCAEAGIVPDVLVNNAGIAVAGRLDHVPQERWETLLSINLLAPMRLTNLFLPAMIERRSGHIVNISSLAGWVGSPGLTSYCASKFGLRGFAEALAVDVEEFDIAVSTVYPFFSRTPILDSPQFGYDEKRKVPDDLVTEPADVVARIVAGIRRNRRHIFPDRTARIVHYLVRFAPWATTLLNRRLEALATKAA